MQVKLTEREHIISSYSARCRYILAACRSNVQNSHFSGDPLSPPTVGRSLWTTPHRTVFWAASKVNFDYRKVEVYDDVIVRATPGVLWSAVSKLFSMETNPTSSGVPLHIRMHLFSANQVLEARLFEIWYRMSDLWSEERRGNPLSRHLFVVR
jgi:hypothetical protein